ncbi:MAG: polysaccharide biosynthesis/export family protein [Bacteroidales bacterium]|jgi:polysaccharide export outer membrane protein|nr:polysaccharide biosynthesis/export family protein [Bacteroidales bacterium]
MKKISNLLFLLIIISATSCTTSKQIIYFQNIEELEQQKIDAEYITKIKKDDLLTIVVSGPDKEVVMPFNLTLTDNASYGSSVDPSKTVLPYLVDSDGYIDFPVLGRIYIEGMTRMELTNYLKEEISNFVKDPVVMVTFSNYKITVLGEVRSPGTYTMPSERTTILQALGMAGDLTITAKREGILLIREIDGVQTHITIDLRSAEIMNSPYFYLHQNDVIYVPPSSSRIAQGTTASTIWSIALTGVTTLATVVTLILTNTKK